MTAERLQLSAVGWCLAGKDGQWQGGMDDACLGPLSALQLMEEGSDCWQPPREHAWASCQASFLLLCWQSEKSPALDCSWTGTNLGVPCRWQC